MIQTH